MSSFRVHELEIPAVIMGSLSLRNLSVWLRLSGVDYTRKCHSILDEVDWNVVSNNIPIALLGIKLDGEASNVTDSVVSALPRLPRTVEKRRNTGVVREVSVKTPALVTSAALLYGLNVPNAPAPRACTARSGIRS